MFRHLLLLLPISLLIDCSDTHVEEVDRSEKLPALRPYGELPSLTDRPTIAHVNIVDLDQDGVLDVLVCDVLGRRVSWIKGELEQDLLSGVAAPVHAEAVDFDMDGDVDVLVAVMGTILPSDAHTGEVIILENDGNEKFIKHVLAKGIQRVTDVQAGDLDGDGDLDLSVAQFGYTQGQVQWFQNDGDWKFTQHQLINKSGAIHAPIADIDNDGDLDVLALLSQEWETVYGFLNDGSGNFTQTILHDVADADFSSSGMTVADLDQDGDEDIIWTNGDAFVAVDYRPLPTHGVQWLENRGDIEFVYHRIGQLDGAYGPSVADMDRDGDLDIVTVAEFAHWDEPGTASVVWWEQGDGGSFTRHNLATLPTHLVTCDVGDLDGDGLPDIVVGGMALYPPFDGTTRVSLWENNGELGSVIIEKEFPKTIQIALKQTKSAGERGMVLHANGFDPRNEYLIAAEVDSQNARWPYYLGLMDLSVGDSASALRYFEQAEILDGAYAPLQARLGELYVGDGNIKLAKDKFRQSNTDHATVALAQLSFDEGNWLEVLKTLQDTNNPAATSLVFAAKAKVNGETHKPYIAVDMGYQMDDPWLAEVEAMCILAPYLVTQAQTDFIGGNILAAERLLRRAIEIDPVDKDARLALANILLRSDRVNETTIAQAIMHLEESLKSDPDYVMTRTKFGWALYLAGRLDEARKVWKAILIDEPHHSPALANLAQLAYNLKHYDKAYTYYRSAFLVPEDSPFAMSANPEFRSSMLYRFALTTKNLGKTQEAVGYLQLAVELAPSNPTIQFELGNTLISQQEFSKALPHVEIANALQLNDPRILAALGYTWHQLGDAAMSLEFLEQSVKLAPTFALGWYHLGNAQLALGNKNAAIDSFTVAVQLQPTFTVAKEALSKLEER